MALDSYPSEKDMVVVITNDLRFLKQCIEVKKKVQKVLGNIR